MSSSYSLDVIHSFAWYFQTSTNYTHISHLSVLRASTAPTRQACKDETGRGIIFEGIALDKWGPTTLRGRARPKNTNLKDNLEVPMERRNYRV